MRVHGRHYRTIFLADDGVSVAVIDQTGLPFACEVRRLQTAAQAAEAIRNMVVRGAPLIGVTPAYGVALGMRDDPSDAGVRRVVEQLGATRPTAVNLRWALERMAAALLPERPDRRVQRAYEEAARIADEDVAACEAIDRHGRAILEQLSAARRRQPVPVGELALREIRRRRVRRADRHPAALGQRLQRIAQNVIERLHQPDAIRLDPHWNAGGNRWPGRHVDHHRIRRVVGSARGQRQQPLVAELQVDRAGERAALAAGRCALRDRVRSSALTDSARFTPKLEEAYRRMWSEWCATAE